MHPPALHRVGLQVEPGQSTRATPHTRHVRPCDCPTKSSDLTTRAAAGRGVYSVYGGRRSGTNRSFALFRRGRTWPNVRALIAALGSPCQYGPGWTRRRETPGSRRPGLTGLEPPATEVTTVLCAQ